MFAKNIHKRIKLVLIFIIFFFVLVVFKVFYIQVIEYDKLNNLANSLWSRNLPIEADRGKIYTIDGEVIADNLTTVSLVLIPNQIKEKDKVANDLAEILNVDVDTIRKHIYKKSSIERIHPEGRRLSFDIADKINKLGYDGVYLVKEAKRFYPHDMLLAHVLGFVGIDNQGLSGLELQYDKFLTGSTGAIKYYSDAKGKRLELNESYVEPVNGLDIYLTVNYKIQASIERELVNAMKKYNANGAWAIAMEPSTGKILGLASYPSFDPNNYKKYSSEELNRNLAIWASYEPGSTFKIVTVSSAINEGVINLNDHFYDGGSIHVENARIKCWKHGGHGDQTYLQVVQNSCNPGFVSIGQKLGKDKLFYYIDKFGFGDKTGIDLNGEGRGILFNLDRVGPVELATTAFGQGVSVTALQQIVAVSAAINGGTLYKPYIVDSIVEHKTGEIVEKHEPVKVRNVISNDTSKTVRMVLESVVALGTGRNAFIEGYRVGGKTGTAQKVNNGVYMVGNYIVSFIGFLPANDPKVIVYVAVDNPKGITQYGGTVSAPIAKSILIDAISALDIEKPVGGLEKEYQWYEKAYKKVENVVGMNLGDAKKVLSDFSIEYTGNGNVVISQAPEAGSSIMIGSVVRLMLSN